MNSLRSTDNSNPDPKLGQGLVDSLDKLGILYQGHLLSEEEFLAAKKKLLED